MTRRRPPTEPPEPADGRSCDGGRCDAESVGWRWFTDLREWLPCCGRHIRTKGVPPEFVRYDAPLEGS